MIVEVWRNEETERGGKYQMPKLKVPNTPPKNRQTDYRHQVECPGQILNEANFGMWKNTQGHSDEVEHGIRVHAGALTTGILEQ